MKGPGSGTSASGGSAWLIALAAGLAGGLAGGLMLPRPSPDASAAPAPADPRTLDALAALTREIGALRAELARRDGLAAAPTPLAPAEAVAPPPAASDPDGAVARLAALLLERIEQRPAGPAGSSIERAPLVDAFEEPAERLPGQQEALKQMAAAIDLDDDGVYRRRFLLLTERQVLDRFGRPDLITVNESAVTWEYSLAEDHNVGFRFVDGIVTDSW